MANEEHLIILNQGVAVWNEWRMRNTNIIPDLNVANLSETDLYIANFGEAELNEAKLMRADMSKVNLSGAKLIRANLTGADLSKANLSKANLFEANLREANLRKAELSRAILSRADLSRANLKGASLNQAEFNETVLGNTNLRNAKNAETIIHFGPSVIDHRTLEISGDLPLEFLRGCGLPDSLIDYLPSILNKPYEFYSCFISYSHQNEDFAKRLHADLQNNGVRCWFAPQDMKIGDRIRHRIDETIRVYDKLLLILSNDSINSQWVEQEVEAALEKERKNNNTVLFPIRVDGQVMKIKSGWAKLIRNTRHIGDFTKWKEHDLYKKAFDRLINDLKSK